MVGMHAWIRDVRLLVKTGRCVLRLWLSLSMLCSHRSTPNLPGNLSRVSVQPTVLFSPLCLNDRTVESYFKL